MDVAEHEKQPYGPYVHLYSACIIQCTLASPEESLDGCVPGKLMLHDCLRVLWNVALNGWAKHVAAQDMATSSVGTMLLLYKVLRMRLAVRSTW